MPHSIYQGLDNPWQLSLTWLGTGGVNYWQPKRLCMWTQFSLHTFRLEVPAWHIFHCIVDTLQLLTRVLISSLSCSFQVSCSASLSNHDQGKPHAKAEWHSGKLSLQGLHGDGLGPLNGKAQRPAPDALQASHVLTESFQTTPQPSIIFVGLPAACEDERTER